MALQDTRNSLARMTMSLPHITQLELLTFDILVGLPMSELARVSRGMKFALENHGEMGKSAQAAMPKLKLGAALLEPRQRLALLGLYMPLKAVEVMSGPSIEVDTVEQAQALSKIALCASRSANKVASRGSTACATVGQFFFSSCRAEMGVNIAVSEPVTVPISPALSNRIFLDEPTLQLSLAWGPRGIFVKGRAANSPAVLIDVYCKHPAFHVDQRHGVVSLNGCWQKAGIGVCSPAYNKKAVLEALASGMLFAISIGDAQAGTARFDMDSKKMLGALSLELGNLIPQIV